MKLHNNKLGSYVIKFINIASYVMLRASKTVIQKQSKRCTQKIVSTFGRKIINQVAVDSRQFSVTIVARHATSPECRSLRKDSSIKAGKGKFVPKYTRPKLVMMTR